MIAWKFVLLLLALGTESLVASQSVVCQSKLGTKSIPASKIPRATTIIHNKLTVLKKVIRKINVVVVPKPTTTTSTEVKTITETTQADPDIETAIETKTDTTTTIEVRLHTTTSISTSFTTTTRYSTTSIIPTPAGFVPAKGPDWRPKVKARDTFKDIPAPDGFPAELQSNPEYVQRIDCTKKVPTTSIKVTTITVKGARITANPKTKTKYVTSTTTSIETQYPPKVTETLFETTISTVTEYEDRTETATTTELVTVESVMPVEYYDACGDTNMLSTANGGKIISSLSIKVSSRASIINGLKKPYECCVRCQQTAECLFSNWSSNSMCLLHFPRTAGLCNNGQIVAASYYTNPTTISDHLLSNGQCGKLTNATP